MLKGNSSFYSKLLSASSEVNTFPKWNRKSFRLAIVSNPIMSKLGRHWKHITGGQILLESYGKPECGVILTNSAEINKESNFDCVFDPEADDKSKFKSREGIQSTHKFGYTGIPTQSVDLKLIDKDGEQVRLSMI